MSDPLSDGSFLQAWVATVRQAYGVIWSIRLVCDELEKRLKRESEHRSDDGGAPGGAVARRGGER